jgi:hypothetical protein
MTRRQRCLFVAMVSCALFGATCSDDDSAPGPADGASADAMLADAAQDAPLEPSGEIGSPCAEDQQCDLGSCLLTRGEGVFPGGYCSSPCDAITDPCPAGASCVGVQDGDCFKICTDQSQCRQGYACKSGPGGGEPKICFPE